MWISIPNYTHTIGTTTDGTNISLRNLQKGPGGFQDVSYQEGLQILLAHFQKELLPALHNWYPQKKTSDLFGWYFINFMCDNFYQLDGSGWNFKAWRKYVRDNIATLDILTDK